MDSFGTQVCLYLLLLNFCKWTEVDTTPTTLHRDQLLWFGSRHLFSSLLTLKTVGKYVRFFEKPFNYFLRCNHFHTCCDKNNHINTHCDPKVQPRKTSENTLQQCNLTVNYTLYVVLYLHFLVGIGSDRPTNFWPRNTNKLQ